MNTNTDIIIINDIRTDNDFKAVTLSGYKKSEVKKELLKSLFSGKIENACYWCAELICCGAFIDIWDIIIIFVSKYIHLANVKLPIYLNLRYSTFRDIVITGYIDNEIKLRNHSGIRELFTEIMVVLCGSHKKHNIERIRVKKEDLDVVEMKRRLKAPNVGYVSSSFKTDDPKEFFIPLNEFAYHLSTDSKNMVEACFWIEWILEFEAVCKKKKDKCICQRRDFVPVTDKLQTDTIWMIWDIIMCEAEKRTDKAVINKILKSLLGLFCIRYNSGVKKKRIYIIYFAIALLTEPYIIKNDVIHNKEAVEFIKTKINAIYKEIKKNEVINDNKNNISNISNSKNKLELMFGNNN